MSHFKFIILWFTWSSQLFFSRNAWARWTVFESHGHDVVSSTVRSRKEQPIEY